MTTPRREWPPKHGGNHEALPESGIFLIDMSTHAITSDRGAYKLLQGSEAACADGERAMFIPAQILEIVSRRDPSDTRPQTERFQIGRRKYRCRYYVLEPNAGSSDPPLMAVHFEVDAEDRVGPLVEEYSLTDREQEVLRGIADGLTTKELAERLKISPNTVKAFVRLIMLKLQVTTRTGIVGKLLEYAADHDPSSAADGNARPAGIPGGVRREE